MTLQVVVELLSHLTGATVHDDVLSFDYASSKFLSEKEMSIILYLPGYNFGTCYRRIYFLKSGYFSLLCYQQSLSFLMAGEYDGESIPIVLPEHKHIKLLDRGGLWRVTSVSTSIFKVPECYFKCATQKPTTKIDYRTIVSSLKINS